MPTLCIAKMMPMCGARSAAMTPGLVLLMMKKKLPCSMPLNGLTGYIAFEEGLKTPPRSEHGHGVMPFVTMGGPSFRDPQEVIEAVLITGNVELCRK